MSAAMPDLLALALKAARRAGGILSARIYHGVEAETGRDIKLEADRAAEALILEVLQAGADPQPVLAEESGAHGELSGRYWVVDPLDGSANYNRRIPFSAVSIALMEGSEPVLGVIHDFNHDETYCGGTGLPARLNDTPITVSDVAEAGGAILATGLPVLADHSPEALADMAAGFAAWKKVRMIGSAAMAAAYVAAGRVDRYAETGTRLWDVAAGMAIVRAAGGRAEISAGAPEAPRRILMDNGRLPL